MGTSWDIDWASLEYSGGFLDTLLTSILFIHKILEDVVNWFQFNCGVMSFHFFCIGMNESIIQKVSVSVHAVFEIIKYTWNKLQWCYLMSGKVKEVFYSEWRIGYEVEFLKLIFQTSLFHSF
jgi:hypothetical protein